MIDITSLLHKSLTIIIICYLIKKMIKELILLTIFYIPYKNNIKTFLPWFINYYFKAPISIIVSLHEKKL